MTHASKKTTILILIAIFVLTMCFSFLAFTKKAYGYTADYEYYHEWWEEGTDTGITDDYTYSDTDSGPVDLTAPTGEHYIGDYTSSWYEEGYVADQSYSAYGEYYEEGIVRNAKEENCGYHEFSDSGSDSFTYTVDNDTVEYTREYDWEVEGYYKQSCPAVRTHKLVCAQINIIESSPSVFELIFFYEYADNNWVRIYDMEGNLVFEVDFPHGHPTVIVDLPDGMYNVEVFHEEGKILQKFVIGKS